MIIQKERNAYNESLKNYRDIKNVVNTAKFETRIEVARELKKNGVKIEIIAQSFTHHLPCLADIGTERIF